MALLVALMAMLVAGVEAVALSHGDADGICFLQLDVEDVPQRLGRAPPLRAAAREAVKVIGKVTRQLIKKWEPKWARRATAAAHRVGPSQTGPRNVTFDEQKITISQKHNSFTVEGDPSLLKVTYTRKGVDSCPCASKDVATVCEKTKKVKKLIGNAVKSNVKLEKKNNKTQETTPETQPAWESDKCTVQFNEDETNQEYVISVAFKEAEKNQENVISVASEKSPIEVTFVVMRQETDLCGAAPYSKNFKFRNYETCGQASDLDEKELSNLKKELLAGIGAKFLERGFGVEFEFVARPPTEALQRTTNEDKDKEFNGEKQTETFENFPKNDGPLSQCFRKMRGGGAQTGGWTFMYDDSVHPFTADDLYNWNLKELKEDEKKDEVYGWSFEVVSPGPPNVLSGKKGLESVVDTLHTLTEIGVQAPPSAGLHVHVNVGGQAPPGTALTPVQVANIWAAYARYQLVIDEFLPPMRINNIYAQSLFLGSSKPIRAYTLLPHEIFTNIVNFFKKKPNGDIGDFCHMALGGTEDDNPKKRKDPTSVGPQPCVERHPYNRYYTLNLATLVRLGTVEFRSHSATYNLEQVLHWTMFHVAFVEKFKDEKFDNFFLTPTDTAPKALERLKKLQKKATLKELNSELPHIKKTITFLKNIVWEKGCKTNSKK